MTNNNQTQHQQYKQEQNQQYQEQQNQQQQNEEIQNEEIPEEIIRDPKDPNRYPDETPEEYLERDIWLLDDDKLDKPIEWKEEYRDPLPGETEQEYVDRLARYYRDDIDQMFYETEEQYMRRRAWVLARMYQKAKWKHAYMFVFKDPETKKWSEHTLAEKIVTIIILSWGVFWIIASITFVIRNPWFY